MNCKPQPVSSRPRSAKARRTSPPQFQEKAEHDKARAIADYIAGMTDRYAIREYRRLFAVEED